MPPIKAFLYDLDNEDSGWRITLARDIYKHIPKDGDKENIGNFITGAVQLILDRFIFIKFLSDKEIEVDIVKLFIGKVNSLMSSNDTNEDQSVIVYELFEDIFITLDKKYKGNLFSKRASLDEVKITNKTLLKILDDFLSINSLYNFKNIPVEILGTIYEQFLGKVIVAVSPLDRKKEELKIETISSVRKGGGVFYTPDYIIKYIVDITVGEKLHNLTVNGGSIDDLLKIKICDPSCGAGSFLIAAYNMLIEWAMEYISTSVGYASVGYAYMRNPRMHNRQIQKIKFDILSSCIFGVDIDGQAVEVTKLSLCLMALERTIGYDMNNDDTRYYDNKLPSLEDNIKCGNSLIGTDIYNSNLRASKNDYDQLNPFDWKKEFWNQFDEKKFDVIIGNPPYITYSLGRGRAKSESIDLQYISNRWKNSCDYKINSFALFYELSHELMEKNSIVAFIVPGTILINDSYKKIRQYLIEQELLYAYHKLDYKVFSQAEMGDCAILVLKNKKNDSCYAYYSRSMEKVSIAKSVKIKYKTIKLLDDFRLLNNPTDYSMLKSNPELISFGEVCKFYNGIKTGNNKKFISEKKINIKYKPVIRGKDFTRYGTLNPEVFVLFDPKQLWSNCDESKLSKKNKLFVRQTADSIIATYDDKSFYPMDTVHIIYESKIDLKILLGIINSKIFNKIYQSLVPEKGKVFAEVKIANLKKMKIPDIQKILSKSKKIESIVDEILTINKDLHNALGIKLITLHKRIDILDNKLNKIIQRLYLSRTS